MTSDEANSEVTRLLDEEKTRCRAILNSDEAKGRGELALYLAFETSLPADTAIAALAKAVIEPPPGPPPTGGMSPRFFGLEPS